MDEWHYDYTAAMRPRAKATTKSSIDAEKPVSEPGNERMSKVEFDR